MERPVFEDHEAITTAVGVMEGLNYHLLPPYLHPDFEAHIAALRNAIEDCDTETLMTDRMPPMIHATGMLVIDNTNIQTTGPRGPALLQDIWLIEKLAHFDREVIPERRMHAMQAAVRTMTGALNAIAAEATSAAPKK